MRASTIRSAVVTFSLALSFGIVGVEAQEISNPGDSVRAAQPLDAEALRELGISGEAAQSPTAPPVVESGGFSWTHGPLRYDGSGNIASIGTQALFYDTHGRLTAATLSRPDQPGSLTQSYQYDAFGNLIARTTGGVLQSNPTDDVTNHLSTAYAEYDAAGNQVRWQTPGGSAIYHAIYDAVGMVSELDVENITGAGPMFFVYTASDERIWSHDGAANIGHWKVRDPNGKVLRDFVDNWNTPASPWSVSRDYFYRDGALLAAATPTTTMHFSLDHLGSPRVITDDGRVRSGFHHYLPFGEEWLDGTGSQEGESLKFTGHERDKDPAGSANGLDYMHARYYSAGWGRFLSVDPVLDIKRTMARPQSWNRYSYALNNPLVYSDPTGTTVYIVIYTIGNDGGDDDFERQARTRAAAIRGMKSFDPTKDIVIVQGVLNRADFGKVLSYAKSLESKYGKVGELDMFSHAGPEDGPTFHYNVAPREQFTIADLKAMNISWAWWGSARFYGCNTGQNFTQRFANAQGVTAWGFSSFSSNSSSPISWFPRMPTGPLYSVQTTSSFTTGSWAGFFRKWTGMDTRLVPMQPADPEP